MVTKRCVLAPISAVFIMRFTDRQWCLLKFNLKEVQTWHYQTLQDGTRTQQEVLAEHLTSRQLAVHPRSPQHAEVLAELATSLLRHRQLAEQLTSRKKSLQLVEAPVVQGTNKKSFSINLVWPNS